MQIHLFDIDIPGKITFIESKTLTAGQTPTIVDTGIMLSLCNSDYYNFLFWLGSKSSDVICYFVYTNSYSLVESNYYHSLRMGY